MGKIYAIVNQKNEYYNDWNDGFIKKINQDILYFDLKCAESILKNLNDRDDMYCDGCKIVELTIYPKQQIADLKAKLAQSEKKQEYLFSSICEYVSQIEELKQQLAETDKLMQEYLSKCLSLEQQLAEKDQAIEGLQEINQSLGQTCNNDEKEIERLREKENLLNLIVDGYYTPTNIVKKQIREQSQTAIAELEKVKTLFKEEFKDKWLEDCGIDYYEWSNYDTAITIIDQRIKQLKGEK